MEVILSREKNAFFLIDHISRMVIVSQSHGFGRVSFDLSIWGSSHLVLSLPLKNIQLFFFPLVQLWLTGCDRNEA